MKKLSEEEIARSRQKVVAFLQSNPEATYEFLHGSEVRYDLWAGYRDRINDARKDAGLPKRFERKKRSARRRELMRYLKSNPEATTGDLRRDGFARSMQVLYDWKLDAAREDAGILEYFSSLRDMKNRQKSLLRSIRAKRKADNYLKMHPFAAQEELEKEGIYHSVEIAYGCIKNARKSLGLPRDNFYSQIFGAEINLYSSPRVAESARQAMAGILTREELGIITMYYGIGQAQSKLSEIALAYGTTERRAWLARERAMKKLKSKSRTEIAPALAPYASDRMTRNFLQNVYSFETGRVRTEIGQRAY